MDTLFNKGKKERLPLQEILGPAVQQFKKCRVCPHDAPIAVQHRYGVNGSFNDGIRQKGACAGLLQLMPAGGKL
jgi:hypothetical protein